MNKVKEANAYLQECARILHGSESVKLPFIQAALKSIAEAQVHLLTFDLSQFLPTRSSK